MKPRLRAVGSVNCGCYQPPRPREDSTQKTFPTFSPSSQAEVMPSLRLRARRRDQQIRQGENDGGFERGCRDAKLQAPRVRVIN